MQSLKTLSNIFVSRLMGEFIGECQISGYPDGGIYLASGTAAEIPAGGNLTISNTGGHGVTVEGDMYTQRSGVQGMVFYNFAARNNKRSAVEDLERMSELLNLPSLDFLRNDLVEITNEVNKELEKHYPDVNLIWNLILAVNNFIEKNTKSLAESAELFGLQRRAQVRRIVAPKGHYQ